MQFIRVTTETAERAVTTALCEALAHSQHVLWLVCGGSNITAEVRVMAGARARAGSVLANLTILPTDERYGKPGHADSNYTQLQDAGFDPGDATWVDILARDVPLEQTVEHYTQLVTTAFARADIVIAQFGIGPDGHIAGILPESPAAVDDAATVVGYSWRDFTRLTITAPQLARVDQAFALAYGDTKRVALERLKEHTEPVRKLPSGLLYDIAEACVYNDFVTTEEA